MTDFSGPLLFSFGVFCLAWLYANWRVARARARLLRELEQVDAVLLAEMLSHAEVWDLLERQLADLGEYMEVTEVHFGDLPVTVRREDGRLIVRAGGETYTRK